MKIVLIGGWGYIGLNLIKQLKNHEIVVIDPHEPTEAECEFLFEQIENVKHVSNELGSDNLGFLHDADVVVSLPGQLGSIPSVESFTLNLYYSVSAHFLLLDVLKNNNLTPLVVFPSSDLTHCYPPRCMYAANKLYLEDAFRIAHKIYGIPYVAFRMATGYGPMQRRDSVVNFFVRRGLEGGKLPVWGEGLNRQAFIYADDVGRAFKMACERMFPTGVYPLVGHNSSLIEIANVVTETIGGEIVYGPFPKLAKSVNVGDLPVVGNPPRFEPEIGLVEGIGRTAKWMRGDAGF